jgi:predicted TIM-barrel fold metal-dependent hydrolase
VAVPGVLLYKTTVTRKGKFSALGTTFSIYEIPDNESVARTMQAHPDRFYGWIFVNPWVTDQLIELEKRANEPGWIGVKTHPFWHRYAVRMLDDVAGYCTERDWPLLMHLGGDEERGDYRYLPERHPGLKVLYAHAGVPFYREVWEYIREKNNLFIDLSNPV